MGKDVEQGAFTREDRVRYRQKVRRCLDVFALMLDDFGFDADRPMTGLEIELNLVDADAEPAMRNAEVLADLADPLFQTELGQFNLELNAPPRLIEGDRLRRLRAGPARAASAGPTSGPPSPTRTIVLIGILPTLTARPPVLDNLSANERYRVLNEQIVGARGEDIELDIRGVERLQTHTDSIAPEAACTSLQFHLQVAPDSFADYWNASQAIAGVQVAVGANSPFLYGRQLWAETRIALFEQATDTRPDELKAQGVRPRVWFGERWITSIFDLFEENVRYFPPLLPICEDEDPVEVLHAGGVPAARRAAAAQRHRLPLEPAGLRHHERPPAPAGGEPGAAGRPDRGRHAGQRRLLLRAGPRAGRGGPADLDPAAVQRGRGELPRRRPARHRAPTLYWPRLGEIPVTDLVLDVLLPTAAAGLDRFGVDPARARPAARHHRAALPHRPQRRGLADRDGLGGRAAPGHGPGRPRCTTCCGATPSCSAATSRSTPGRSTDPPGPPHAGFARGTTDALGP